MAKPINISEHNSSFIKFLIFFLITLAMAVMAIYTNYRLPKKELSTLRENSDQLDNMKAGNESYKIILTDIMKSLKKFDSADAQKPMIMQDLANLNEKLLKVKDFEDDNTSLKLKDVILRLVTSYQKEKADFFDLNNDMKQIDLIRTQRHEFEEKYTKCQRNFDLHNQTYHPNEN